MSAEVVEHTTAPTAPMATVPEAAAVLGIATSTAYELVRRGEFPVPVVKVGRQHRVPRQALDRFVSTGEV